MTEAAVGVVGAGPAGLATAAMLKAEGVRTVVLEQSTGVGTTWQGHYDRLHLHTARTLSQLPDLGFPRRYGRWVPRDGVVSYLEAYTDHHGLEIRFDTTVRRLEPREGGWLLDIEPGDPIAVERVVVATGYNRRSFLPAWPGRDDYRGEILHASAYRNAAPYRGKEVVVVGAGNSGAEIAVDLVEGGAAAVRLSVRTPPQVFPRQALGIPSQAIGICLPHLPVAVGDRIAALLQRVFVGDLTRFGMPRPEARPYSDYLERNAVPLLDVGMIRLLKRGELEVVGAVDALDADGVVLADGSRVRADAVIAATGYRRDLEPLVGHLGVLRADGLPLVHGADTHPDAPGLHFAGFTNPITGNLRELGIQARGIARASAS